MTNELTVGQLFDQLEEKLQLEWWAGRKNADQPIRGRTEGTTQAQVGGLNWIHPNRVQIIGPSELDYLHKLKPNSLEDALSHLFAARPAAVLLSDDISADPALLSAAQQTNTPLLRSPLPDSQIIFELQYYLTNALAEPLTVHGVFMEVMGMGILLTGEAGIGKSELALELITRGHRLIADDAPRFARIAPDILTGSCPPLLDGFLEVRGLGILNIRAMFGDSAVKLNKYLRLILHLERQDRFQLAELDRFSGSNSSRTLLGLEIPQITLPVAPGRSLAILVEAAVGNHQLRRQGYSAADDFIQRQANSVEAATNRPIPRGSAPAARDYRSPTTGSPEPPDALPGPSTEPTRDCLGAARSPDARS